ncbi:TraB/GumN family protein [Rhodanobacter sp. C05]|uniref:TraB/GumN family protein n=1 Tax=Rhodanobacter sp. C05 TaxID=1945855 RepID=UPI0009D2C099|nr:TraB/GumN family protein [Rhodanobacter sp. C05]OOG40876.1 TraB/GumN family protein [Rhodanobacter sp. C05]
MKPTSLVRLLVCVALLLPVATIANPALWVVRNAHTTIYLFGTVHLLPDDTHWHYPALDKALADSDSLTIELTDDDSATMQSLVLQYGLDPTHPLSDQLSASENAALLQAAQTAGVPGGMQTLQIMRPWLAGLTLAVEPLIKAGLDPAHGVDKLLKAQMLQAGKPVNGMETSEQQIRMLADLPTDVQLDFLRSTLRDIDKGPAELTRLISAWKDGDTDSIARIENDEVRQQAPALYQRLLVQRNQAWAGKIAAMLQQPGTVFIAVGAAHLAGPDSVQVQLHKLGVEAARQ